MAEIEGAVGRVHKYSSLIGRQFQSLSIVFDRAVNTMLASRFGLEFSLQLYMKLTGLDLLTTSGGATVGRVCVWGGGRVTSPSSKMV